MIMFRRVTSLLLICSIFMVDGCTQTIKVDPVPLPAPSNDSPLSAYSKMTVLIKQFQDERENKNIIGSGSGLIIKTDRDVTELVEQAIVDQLEEDGYEVVRTDIGKPDIVIEGAVTAYWISFESINIDNFTDIATVEAKMAVTSRPEPADVPLTTYVGRTSISKAFGISESEFKDAIINSVNGALLDMVQAFVGDSRVSKALYSTYDLKKSRSR